MTNAAKIAKYFRAHAADTQFNVIKTKDEALIVISREDFERYLESSVSCVICGETHRPYTKGELLEFDGRMYHEKCIDKD